MAEPLNIGGVSFSKTEVAKQEVKTKERTSEKGTWEQYKEYTVTLKDGTKVTYEQQNEERKATVDIQDDGSVNFYGLSSAEIRDTEKDDTYRLMGCEFTSVQARREPKGIIFKDPADHDKISTYNREMPDGSIQESKENVARVNAGDMINNSRAQHTFYPKNIWRFNIVLYKDYRKRPDLMSGLFPLYKSYTYASAGASSAASAAAFASSSALAFASASAAAFAWAFLESLTVSFFW